jgi:hypothetical protein
LIRLSVYPFENAAPGRHPDQIHVKYNGKNIYMTTPPALSARMLQVILLNSRAVSKDVRK